MQNFNMDDDEVDIVVIDNLDWTYTISVLPTIMSGRLRLKQKLF